MSLTAKNTNEISHPLVIEHNENVAGIIAFLEGLSDQEYSQKFSGVSSIGAHIRHIIDFYNCFLGSFAHEVIDYDNRQRNKELETNKQQAIKKLVEISQKLSSLPDEELRKEVIVKESVSVGFKADARSNYEREMMFLYTHTTHHLGIIKTILSLTGRDVCASFGKAPSTIIYENNSK